MNHSLTSENLRQIREEVKTSCEVAGVFRERDYQGESPDIAELVHDLRQPLSTIESLTYYLELVCTDMHAHAQLHRIQEMLVQANRILERASEQHSS